MHTEGRVGGLGCARGGGDSPSRVRSGGEGGDKQAAAQDRCGGLCATFARQAARAMFVACKPVTVHRPRRLTALFASD